MRKRPDPTCDPRILRTRRTLHASLLELATERDLDTVSVADVTEHAQVNRATFYAHYRNLDELLEAALQSELEELVSVMTRFVMDLDLTTPAPVPEPALAFFRSFDRRFALYRRVFSPNGSAKVVHGLRRRLTEAIEEKLRHEHDARRSGRRPSIPLSVHAHALAGSVVGTLVYWLNAKPRPSVQRMATWSWTIVTHSIRLALADPP